MASGGAGNGAFVVVFQEVTDGADIAETGSILRGKRQGGEEADVWRVGEVRAEKGEIC